MIRVTPSTESCKLFATATPECDDQPVVQLRTASRRVSGDGSDPSFAIDNISVTGEKLQSTPVELSSFTVGTNAQNKVLLSWITRSETGLRGFYILRAQEPVLDEACLISPLITAANSSEGQSYSFTDEELFQSGCYNYWLQSADLDGGSSFHGPVHIEYSAEGSPSSPIRIRQPCSTFTPTLQLTFITYSLQEAGEVSFSIYNLRGQLLRRINPAANPPARIRSSGKVKTSLAKAAPAASTNPHGHGAGKLYTQDGAKPNELRTSFSKHSPLHYLEQSVSTKC